MSVTVWVVDDDRSIRWVLEKALGQEGYAVTCFEDGDEALNTLEEGGQEPEVLISDVRMPGTDGLRMLKILQRKNPDLPVIIMTAPTTLRTGMVSPIRLMVGGSTRPAIKRATPRPTTMGK